LSGEHVVRKVCQVFKITAQGYYKQRVKRLERGKVEHCVIKLVQKTRRLHVRMGGKKLYELHREEIHRMAPAIGRDKFFKILKRYNQLIIRKRKYARTTQSNHRFRKYRNLSKDFRACKAHELWVGDITYIRTRQGFIYLSLLTDGYSRKIIGWDLSRSLAVEGAMRAGKMALEQCRGNQVIHHTDRGFQYCSPGYVEQMEKRGVKMSMGEAGNCYDNAMAERVNGILKQEYSLDATFENYEIAKKTVREGIKLYNEQRPHWGLKLKTPAYVHALE
jgi:putative transposase